MADSADDVHKILLENFATAATAGELDAQLDEFMENEIVPVWQGHSPVGRTGKYKASVQVTQKAHDGKGQVGATSPIANLVEYGSEHNPEYAPRLKTIEHFNGAAAST
jgi:hypothetical protein